MRLSKKEATALGLALVLSSASAVYASPFSDSIGGLAIKDLPPAEQEAPQDGFGSFQIPKNDIGKLNVSEDVIDDYTRSKNKPDSQEVARLKKQLTEVVHAANEMDYEKALLIMEHLRAEHPESRVVLKWLAIYQNWSGRYEESLRNFDALRNSDPLNDRLTDFMAQYYMTDDRRNLGLDAAKSLETLKALAEKEDANRFVGDIDSKTLAKALVSYQEFMLTTKDGTQGITPTDSKALDTLWKQIPKEKQAHLDNFYGYNIDALTPIYASFYHRKDLADEYAKRQDKRQQRLAAAEIKKQVKPAEVKAPAEAPAGKAVAPDSH